MLVERVCWFTGFYTSFEKLNIINSAIWGIALMDTFVCNLEGLDKESWIIVISSSLRGKVLCKYREGESC
jgi:hypothetical protein